MAHKGFLVIADISGYTAFLTQGELEHAQDILQSLTHTLLDQTKSPLIVSKLEGDAVFSYAPEHSFALGQTLLEALENMYYAFTSARERMKNNTTCTCTACTLIPSLDLKIALHAGEYLIQKIGKGEELSGPDVIAVHRLLKNTVIEKTGIEAYLFISEKAAQSMGLGEMANSMIRHTDTYEHIGELAGYVHDLKPVWQRLKSERRIILSEKEIWIQVSAEVSAPPQVVWEYILEPSRRTRFMGGDVVGTIPEDLQNGRMGVGSGLHCDHGSRQSKFYVKEWRPFESVVFANEMMPGLTMLNITHIEPAGSGSIVTSIFGKPEGSKPMAKLLALILPVLMKNMMMKVVGISMQGIDKLVAEDVSQGALVMASPAAVPEPA
jgi:hypothetical protein